MALTSIPLGSIFPVLGVSNSFGDYTELNIYPIADWAKFCDGSQIIDIDSPLNGQYVPDLTSAIPLGDNVGGVSSPESSLGEGFFAFGEWVLHQTITNTSATYKTKFYMRIK